MITLWIAVCVGSFLPLAKIPDLKPLVDFATRHRIPMPPRDAPLVFAHDGVWSGDVGVYSPAFLLEQKSDGSIVILRGLDRETLKPTTGFHKGERLWLKFTPVWVDDVRGGFETEYGFISTFVCAVQLAARGDFATARGLLMRFAEGHVGNGEDPFKDAPLTLARCYADHLEHRVLQGAANWRDVRARMEVLFDDVPDLKIGQRKALLTDLAATLDAKPPPEGSVEAFLLDWAGRPAGSTDSLLPDWAAGPEEPVWVHLLFNFEAGAGNAPAREIVLRGFDAVPALLALLEDRRVTAHDAFIGDIERVGDLAGELLQEIAGIPPENDPLTFRPAKRSPAYWRTWWERTRGVKERGYYTSRVFRTNWVGRVTGVNPPAAQIIAHKFPDLLPALCEEFSKRAGSDADSSGLADAVAAAPRAKEERVKILAAFAGREPVARRLDLLGTLARVDVEASTQLLLPILAPMPRAAEGPYGGYPEVTAAWVVAEVPDDRVWKEYLRIARRADVGLRLEMIDRLTDAPVGKKNRERLLAYLAAFLNDEAVRDYWAEPKKYGKGSPAADFEKIAVRDFAAMKLADILGLDDEPDPAWDAIQWAKLRNAVRRKLAGEQWPELGPPGSGNR
ncbi:MAG: hypothetical protein JWO38_533 [Gemmataceae bacterium]|nr:hypothetical protein [Gemmataceae bacterium]